MGDPINDLVARLDIGRRMVEVQERALRQAETNQLQKKSLLDDIQRQLKIDISNLRGGAEISQRVRNYVRQAEAVAEAGAMLHFLALESLNCTRGRLFTIREDLTALDPTNPHL